MTGALLVAILLGAGGEVFRRTAAFEDTLSDAQERMATQSPGGALISEDAERAVRWTLSLPVVGALVNADLRRVRALESYWRDDYAALEAPEPEGEPADAAIRFVAANAKFRDLAQLARDGQAVTQRLDDVLRAYVAVLEVDPGAVDAAYNYEFVSRVRGLLAAGRGNGVPLRSRSNLQGDKGLPPSQTKPSEFNIIVPLRPDERRESEPQAGTVIQRKG